MRLPLDDATAEKMAQRLWERPKARSRRGRQDRPTIEALATVVREHLEAGELAASCAHCRGACTGLVTGFRSLSVSPAVSTHEAVQLTGLEVLAHDGRQPSMVGRS